MTMRLVSVGIGALMLSSGAVHAADLIIEEPLPIAASAYDWSGLYLGVHAGYLSGEAGVVEGDIIGDINGGVAGLYAGYNVQMDNIVLGVEGDFGIAAVSGTGTVVPPPGDEYIYDLNWNGHLRARGGFAADQFLVYVAGGLAFANHTLSEGAWSNTQTHVGWTLGVGAELAVTDTVAVRAEYLYDDYGSADYMLEDPYTAVLKGHTVRLGLSVSF